MGLHMAKRLVRRVPATHVFDLNGGAVASAVGDGCIDAGDAVTAVNHEMVLTSLPRSSDVNALAMSALEAGNIKPGMVWVDMTSGHPDESRTTAAALKEAGASFLDAGVAGGPRGAEAGTLACMVGGEADDIARARPLMEELAAKIVHVGPVGAGHAVKGVNNTLLASHIVVAAEGLIALVKQGVPVAAALDAINGASGRSLVTEERIPNHVLSGEFDFGFKLELMRKDIDVCMRQLDSAQIEAPLLRHVAQIFADAETTLGGSNLEHMEVIRAWEQANGVELRSPVLAAAAAADAATPAAAAVAVAPLTPAEVLAAGCCDLPSTDPDYRVWNFSAGPACLPLDVLKEVRDETLNWDGRGMSFMEMSHRDPQGPVQDEMQNCTELIREMMAVPDDYHVLFMHGGAHAQFSAVPLNLLGGRTKADYLDVGYWSVRAAGHAEAYCEIGTPAVCRGNVPPTSEWKLSGDASEVGFVHLCLNETIAGLEITDDNTCVLPEEHRGIPVIADGTSTLMSRPVDVSKYGAVYASSGKNLGPAGVTTLIIRDDLLPAVDDNHAATDSLYGRRDAHPLMPPIMSFAEAARSLPIPSIYNTPPTFNIYMLGKMLRKYKADGGLAAMEERAIATSGLFYDIVDSSDGFYVNKVEPFFRSRMNVCFTVGAPAEPLTPAAAAARSKVNRDLETRFTREASEAGLLQLMGHPIFGGLRVTLYNSVPQDAIVAAAEFMARFAEQNRHLVEKA
jgi:phosphoserine aminotransferase